MLVIKTIGQRMVAGLVVMTVALAGGQVVLSESAVAGQQAGNSISKLTLTYRPSAISQSVYTVSCRAYSATGTHPNKKAICAAIAKQGIRLFTPVPIGTMCTQIYGGPQKAKIVGTVHGRKINAAFNRSNGCQIARWSNARAFFTFP